MTYPYGEGRIIFNDFARYLWIDAEQFFLGSPAAYVYWFLRSRRLLLHSRARVRSHRTFYFAKVYVGRWELTRTRRTS